jgi:hypothetical protein
MAVLYSWPNPPADINIAHIRRMGRGNTEPVNDEVFIQLRRIFSALMLVLYDCEHGVCSLHYTITNKIYFLLITPTEPILGGCVI